MGSELVIIFTGHVNTYLMNTVYKSVLRKHKLVFSDMVFTVLLCSSFQQWLSPFPWVFEMSPASATATLNCRPPFS
jgi:hypothetical protein